MYVILPLVKPFCGVRRRSPVQLRLAGDAEFRVRPHGFVAAEHIHPQQGERFEVLSGTMRYRINGEEHEAGAGTVLNALKGTPHIWWNGGQDELRMFVSYEPALQTQEFFQSFFSIAQQARNNARTGMPNPLQTTVIARGFAAEVRLAWLPLAVQKVILGTLAALELDARLSRKALLSGCGTTACALTSVALPQRPMCLLLGGEHAGKVRPLSPAQRGRGLSADAP
jgi:hypothetical protein